MDGNLARYHTRRLERVKAALERNRFAAWIAADRAAAKVIFLERILPESEELGYRAAGKGGPFFCCKVSRRGYPLLHHE